MSYMAEGSKLPCYLPIERICTAWEKIWILNAPLSVRENCEDDSQAVVCFLFSKHRSASMHYIWIWKQGVIPDLTRVLSLTTPTIVYHKSEVYYYIKMALTSQHKQRNRFFCFFYAYLNDPSVALRTFISDVYSWRRWGFKIIKLNQERPPSGQLPGNSFS